ncbi:peptidase [Limoniibacter endophyticus]|uniref:Peptidase n=1 Tax=Limoniibacter endophyticus TaxID=1565040 RepID=A0A8J3GFZ3_9HYPH|nr:peptidase [Limoniibacter endophyticus]GHC69687.1 peptidase [Limoniibacter endophyticus]
MTYCVGMRLDKGLVFMSDTRTNAGVDDIASVKKMYSWEVPGERLITLLSAGNLGTTQAVVGMLEEQHKRREDRQSDLHETNTLFQTARLIGDTVKATIRDAHDGGPMQGSTFHATFIMGGQIKGEEPRLFFIYPEGNFVEATNENPFFQIGENKYGKPILVRAYEPGLSFEAAAKLLLISFDSTLKSNLSVGMPLDFQVYETDALCKGPEKRFEVDDIYYQEVSGGWSHAIKSAFNSLRDYSFEAQPQRV